MDVDPRPSPSAGPDGATLRAIPLQRRRSILWRALVAAAVGGAVAALISLLDLDPWESPLGVVAIVGILGAALTTFHLLLPGLSAGERVSGSLAGLVVAVVVGPVGGMAIALLGSFVVGAARPELLWEEALDASMLPALVGGLVLAAVVFALVLRRTVLSSRRTARLGR